MVDEISEEGPSYSQVNNIVNIMDSLETTDSPLAKRCKNQPWIFYLNQKKIKKASLSRIS